MRKLFTLSLVAVVLLSCKKDKNSEDVYDTVPALTFESVNSTFIHQYKDSVIIYVRYRDLDGDLGRQNPDDNSLYIKDERLPYADYYHIPPIIPDGTNFKTRGTIRIVVPTLFLFGNGGDEKTILTIKVKDQADHWSNEITTPQIVVTQ